MDDKTDSFIKAKIPHEMVERITFLSKAPDLISKNVAIDGWIYTVVAGRKIYGDLCEYEAKSTTHLED